MVLRIFKMIATSGFLTAFECTKFIFGRGSAPDPPGGAYSAPPDPLARLRSPTSKGEGGEEEGKGRQEGERKGTGDTGPHFANSCICPWVAHLICIHSSRNV